ncbi:LysR family transcriptional regulator [Aminobacter niigataensis]|uniref:LysR family transcriptional regulator n=1 Tax=Aminobacter niigataensis TaxID=83265 RepID=UPI0024CCBECB|nr:LysR family transcriptional regulator [Aminobacter niigataensis]CAI2932949.1 D-serine dehydratase transcriptional activator [Aminobacter niigataensis]
MRTLDPTMAADLFVFSEVTACGSFTGAAERMRVTQGAVSQRIARLEKRLGEPLFFRGSRGLALTSMGASLAEAVRPAMDQIAEALLKLGGPFQPRRLRISCSGSLALDWLGGLILQFQTTEPAIEIELVAEDDLPEIAKLRRESIDLAIRYDSSPPQGLMILAVLDSLIFPVCTSELRTKLARDKACSFTRLHDAHAWPKASRTAEWDAIDAVTSEFADRRHKDVYFNLSKLALQAAAQGAGVAIGRTPLVNQQILNGSLVPATSARPIVAARYYFLSLMDAVPSAALTSFVSYVCDAWPSPLQTA